MIPSRRLIILATILAIPLLLSGANQALADIALLINLLLAGVAFVDLMISPGPSSIEIHREVSEVLSVGASNPPN